jgi:hypothetical protein
MRTGKATARLEANRLKRLRNGNRGSLIPFVELTDIEKVYLTEELMKDVTVARLSLVTPADEFLYDTMFLQLLNEWGVMCPHPWKSVNITNHGFLCNVCGCEVVHVQTGRVKVRRGS